MTPCQWDPSFQCIIKNRDEVLCKVYDYELRSSICKQTRGIKIQKVSVGLLG